MHVLIPESRFQYAVHVVLKHEGGYSNDPDDPGGQTSFGISQRFIQENDIQINVKHLSAEQASDIYRQYWWDKYHYNTVKDLQVATKLFDLSVNVGPEQAHKILQRAINTLQNQHLGVDGIFGPHTVEETNKQDPEKIIDAIRREAATYYMDLVRMKPQLHKFLHGWLDRLAS